MEEMKKIVAIGLLGTFCSLILKKEAPVFSLFTGILTGIFIFIAVFSSFENVISTLKSIFYKADFDVGIVNYVFKICAVGILGEYFCNIAEDCGEKAIAKKMELASKIIILTLVLPIVVQIIENVWNAF